MKAMITMKANTLQKLDFSYIIQQLEEIKASAADRRSQTTYQPASQELLDFSHLNARNLEDHDWIEKSYKLRAKSVPLCGGCQDGWIIERSEGQAPTARECKRCHVPRSWLYQLNRLNLPSTAVNMHLDSYEPDSEKQQGAIDQVVKWLKRELIQPPSIYMYGRCGNGKSSLLYALAREACYMRKRVKYSTHSHLMNEIKRSWDNKHKGDPLETWLDGVDVLLLDEFGGIGGSAKITPWFVETTIQMINQAFERWSDNKLLVVITSNVYPRDLFSTFANEAFQSRLVGMCEPVEMVGKDRRVTSESLKKWGF